MGSIALGAEKERMMKRILFRLSMPSNSSWDGKWSGREKNYTIRKNITDKKFTELFGDRANNSWFYNFGDGWTAKVTGRLLDKGERAKKSDGFCGYNWMVNSIIWDNEIKTRI